MTQKQPPFDRPILRNQISNNHHALKHLNTHEIRTLNTEGELGKSSQVQTGLLDSPAFWGSLLVIITILTWAGAAVYGFMTALIIQTVITFIMAVIGLFFPSLGVIAVGMISGINAIASEYILTGGWLRFNSLNYWLLIVMVLSLPFLFRLKDPITRLLQLFIVILFMGLIYSENVPEGLDDILNILTTFALVFYIARGLQNEEAFYWLGITNGVLGAVIGLMFNIQFQTLPYSNPNNWTYLQLSALFSICIGLYFANRLKKSRLILLFLTVLNFAWIFLSGSRGSMVIAILCIGYIFLASRSLTLNSIMLGLMVLVGIWISSRFIEQQVTAVSRIQLLFNENETESTRTSKRSQLFLAGIELFKDNPLGIGTGSFREESAQTRFVQLSRPAHSAWLKTLVENGIPGFLILAGFVISFAVFGIRSSQKGDFLFGLFITVVFISAFIVKEFQEKSLWLLASMGIVVLNASYIRQLFNNRLKREPSRVRRLGEMRLTGRK